MQAHSLLVTIEQFEQAVMTVLLAVNYPVLAALRAQYNSAGITTWKFTGAGFFSEFGVSPEVPCVHSADFEIGDVFLELQGVASAVMTILFVRSGVIDFLEVVTLTAPWPEQLHLQSCYY